MIEARKERVRELIRSLESVQVRGRDLGEGERAFKGRLSSFDGDRGSQERCGAFPARNWPRHSERHR